MRELTSSNNPVLLSYIDALLNEAGIFHEIADLHVSIVQGSMAPFPRRVMVHDEDFEAAREIVRRAIANPPPPDAE
jgi:hypothetical protein